MKNTSKISINKVYTKVGDSGFTHLVGGQKLPKDDVRIEAYGMVDELNCVIGGCREKIQSLLNDYSDLSHLQNTLLRIQNELFTLGSVLATLPEDIHPKMERINKKHITQLESEIDTHIVIYLNRLSDALFVWSRWTNKIIGVDELFWERK